MYRTFIILLKKITLILTYFLYKLTNLRLFMHIHYWHYKNLVSNFTDAELTIVDKKKITYQNPQNPDIIYKDEFDMYNKFNNYIINHNTHWSSYITFSRIHLTILIKNSQHMKKNTPVMKVIKRYLNTYKDYSKKVEDNCQTESKCPFSGAIDISKIKIEENKKLHLFMMQTHLMPNFIAECFHFESFEIEKLRKVI
jgi:hypothetical protein